jgi:hypothetical protein
MNYVSQNKQDSQKSFINLSKELYLHIASLGLVFLNNSIKSGMILYKVIF